ncbi:hypothetical protein ABK040_005521 [Willaertia magna]
MQEFEIHPINNNQSILPQTLKNNFAIVFSSSQKYLITNCNNYFIKAFENGFFLINKFSGIVYFYGHKESVNSFSSYNIIFNKTIHLLDFTKNDPIKNIFTKFPAFFAMISKNNNVYLFSKENKHEGLVPKEKFENEKVIQIACGGVHVLFLTENNNLFGAGNSFDGSLSINSYGFNTDIVKCDTSMIGQQKIKEIDVSYNCSFILTVDGDLFATGSCSFGVSGQPQGIHSCKKFTKIKSNVEKIIAGYFFVALKTFENEYFIFGYNNCNQFGEVDPSLMENDKIYGTNTKLMTFNIHDIDQLQCGGYHSMIVNKNQDIYISGNGFGNSIINGNHKCYTKIEMTKVIENWENCKRDFNFKLDTGFDFILIYSERKRNYFNFINAYKIADTTFNFSN